MTDVSERVPPVDVIDLTCPDVIDLDAPEVVDVGPRRSWSWRRAGVVALVVALVLAVSGTVWLYRQGTAYRSTPEWVAVTTYLDAANANDLDRLRMSVTNDVVWTGYDPKGAVVATYSGEDYILFQQQFLPTFHLEQLGEPRVYGDVVAVPLHVSGPLGVDYDSMTTFAVRMDGGAPRVEAIMAIPVG
jgi:hypothetical protein